ncbi:testis-expressed protein 12 isoform X1 [Dendrobates tinctorius]|uniref:testis-expressed protein 12 isoform X1 n=2 Tax=Dendrobates tinctorius TaxID=92724 RepID=UPI003CC9DBE1
MHGLFLLTFLRFSLFYSLAYMETMASSTGKYESKVTKRKKENEDPNIVQCSSATNLSSMLSDSPKVEDMETLMKDLSKDVSLLFSNYAKTLSERSAVDSLQVHKFEEILVEARSLEMQIRQKKENLRNHLSTIAKTLQK